MQRSGRFGRVGSGTLPILGKRLVGIPRGDRPVCWQIELERQFRCPHAVMVDRRTGAADAPIEILAHHRLRHCRADSPPVERDSLLGIMRVADLAQELPIFILDAEHFAWCLPIHVVVHAHANSSAASRQLHIHIHIQIDVRLPG